MIKPVRREETWHREARGGYPDPLKMLHLQFKEVDELRETPRDGQPDALPDALEELAEWFEECGWDDFASRTHHEVLEHRRKAGDAEKLRRVLTSLRDNLMRQKRYEEGLAVTREELPLARQLAVPGQYSTEIANTARYWITNLLGKLGRHTEAAQNAGEAVAELRGQQPVKNGPPAGYGLAHAQREYARRLVTIGEHERAAGFAAEAAAFWRQHAQDATVNCHIALDELTMLQLRLGRFEEAHASGSEAVAVIRQRAESKGEWHFLSDLAAVLNNYSNRLRDLGLDEAAVQAAQESADRYRALAAKAEGRALIMKMELRLALALVSLGSRLHDTGRLDDAFAASDEAIALATRHADREIGRKELARAWTNRASALISRRAYAEAAEAAAKGIELYQTADGKTMARNTFALASAYAGELDVALEASEQSVAEYRERHAGDPYEYAYLLAAHRPRGDPHAAVRTRRGHRRDHRITCPAGRTRRRQPPPLPARTGPRS